MQRQITRPRSKVELHVRRTKLQYESIHADKVRQLGQKLNLIQKCLDRPAHYDSLIQTDRMCWSTLNSVAQTSQFSQN